MKIKEQLKLHEWNRRTTKTPNMWAKEKITRENVVLEQK